MERKSTASEGQSLAPLWRNVQSEEKRVRGAGRGGECGATDRTRLARTRPWSWASPMNPTCGRPASIAHPPQSTPGGGGGGRTCIHRSFGSLCSVWASVVLDTSWVALSRPQRGSDQSRLPGWSRTCWYRSVLDYSGKPPLKVALSPSSPLCFQSTGRNSKHVTADSTGRRQTNLCRQLLSEIDRDAPGVLRAPRGVGWTRAIGMQGTSQSSDGRICLGVGILVFGCGPCVVSPC